MIVRTLFDAEHDTFRESTRHSVDAGILPHHEHQEGQGYVGHVIWEKMAAADYRYVSMSEVCGGTGVNIYYSTMLIEETAHAGATGLDFGLCSEVVALYLLYYGSEVLKRHHLPKLASAEAINVIVVTELSASSDLQGVCTIATRSRDGSHCVLNGSKIFITNGQRADVVIAAARTTPEGGVRGVNLFAADASMEGFSEGKCLKKVGIRAQGIAEPSFNNVCLLASNLLGEGHRGSAHLMQELPWERLQITTTAIALAGDVLEWTLHYVRKRRTLGKSILNFQTARHVLAELKTEVQIDRVFVDQCIVFRLTGRSDAATVSMAKYWTIDLQFRVMDCCMQLHGGCGYMWECPIVRAWAGSRMQQIYDGTNEIMKELITRTL